MVHRKSDLYIFVYTHIRVERSEECDGDQEKRIKVGYYVKSLTSPVDVLPRPTPGMSWAVEKVHRPTVRIGMN